VAQVFTSKRLQHFSSEMPISFDHFLSFSESVHFSFVVITHLRFQFYYVLDKLMEEQSLSLSFQDFASGFRNLRRLKKLHLSFLFVMEFLLGNCIIADSTGLCICQFQLSKVLDFNLTFLRRLEMSCNCMQVQHIEKNPSGGCRPKIGMDAPTHLSLARWADHR
jgi:hypothetical protein